ncbi:MULTISPECIES: histidine--tRNA ligase [unclassified Bosea (in: a-proteobacteria)]|uniref:histidine--tRNA ligase n=1 Tax=unclassified Bosea (in: a-proteobacteria) TaxID=2653178 RepID=UPI000F74D75C|nr:MULTISPECIES: histidine--tRNA ligase [unclassified Bosea (in: a-proteobacteria)]AZO78471.1 histidine--tRNA ligase [Bosea sp. Tri-49]RXT20038.1 histidine--tRNA ligase [Bosea sp. Tri-39]RXT36911.1 histidine--tRNA ligase [Bosea sp. Tri-54]
MSADKSVPAKLKARQPRGFVDRGPADVAATERMLAVIRESFSLYGFDPVETPFVEYTDALGKFLPDQDRPNEGVFSFQDDDEQWLSLRYDLTAPLARYVAENFDALPKPYRSYRAGYVFRNEKPGPGRFRQFMQFDADIVGSGTVAADAEICMLAADTMEKLGIKRGDYVVKVNNRKVLDGVMEAIGLGGDENAGRRLTVLRAIDKLDKFGPEGVRLLLGEGRKDESGDFTKGAGLEALQSDYILAVVRHEPGIAVAGNEAGQAREWSANIKRNALTEVGFGELDEIQKLVRAGGYGADRIKIDPSVVRGLEYYTGPVYEVELTFPVTNEDGQVVRFGSVAGGGRYDGLVGRFRPEPVPATGFSIGVSRLYSALKAVKSPIVDQKNELPLVVVTAMDNKSPEFMPGYQAFVSQLRQAKGEDDKPLCRADLYLGSSGFNAQMKYADRRGAACAVIQGSSEREAGTVVIKDLILGAELAAAGRDVKDSAEHKERQAQAQFSVPVGELVEGVKRVLARH